MEKETAKKIIEETNRCIEILNSLLVDVKVSLNEEEYSTLRRSIAKIIDTVDAQVTNKVIEQYPDLSPYQ